MDFCLSSSFTLSPNRFLFFIADLLFATVEDPKTSSYSSLDDDDQRFQQQQRLMIFGLQIYREWHATADVKLTVEEEEETIDRRGRKKDEEVALVKFNCLEGLDPRIPQCNVSKSGTRTDL